MKKITRKKLARIFKKLPLKLRLFLILLVGSTLVLTPAIVIRKKFPKQYQPEFKAQLIGPWDYTLTSPQGNLKTSLGVDENNAKMQVKRGKSTVSIASPLNQAQIEQQDNYVIYKTANDLISIKYQPLEEGVKEEIILAADPHLTTFVSKISLSSVEPRITADGQIVFVDPNGEYQFHIQPPFAKDNTGNTTYDLKYRILEIEDENATSDELSQQLSAHEQTYLDFYKDEAQRNHVNQQLFGKISEAQAGLTLAKEYYLVLEVDPNWLQSPERQYPIIIDPTIVHDETTEFTGQLDRVTDTGSGSNPSLETYYQELSADEHTVGLWHMNEAVDNSCDGGEDVCDSSGNDNDGTFSGTTTIVNGKLNKGRYLTGDDSLSTSSNYNFTHENFSIEMWIKPIDTSNNPVLISNGGYNTNGYYMHLGPTGIIAFGTHQSGANQYTHSKAVFTTDDWHHMGIVRNGASVKIYCDGQDVTNSAGNHLDPASTSNPFTIGTYYPSPASYYYNGYIDEVRVSNIARTPEEIKVSASRRPYSIYTSGVINTTGVISWNSLSWDEWGVGTGDGEIVYDSTDLVAQWNFNETSGTTADNAAGSCGNNCDGTLSGFDSTASQDADPDSGWTAVNRRWGAGGLQFDGTNSFINTGSDSALDLDGQSFSFSFWARNTKDMASITSDNYIISKGETGTTRQSLNIGFQAVYDGNLTFSFYNDDLPSKKTIRDFGWHHYVATYDTTTNTQSIYIDGQLDNTRNTGGDLTNTNSGNLGIGRAEFSDSLYYSGVLDAIQLYSRPLPAHEIASLYNATNIELQTRSGTDSTPNDGSWSDWAPATSENSIFSFDEGTANWNYRKAIAVSHTGDAVTEYQVMVDGIDTASLITASKLQSDCDDLRFTNSSGELLNYSIVGKSCNTDDTKIWVQVDSIPASGGTTLYMFYGNPTANSYQDEIATFSYSEEKNVAYILHDDTTDLEIISFADGNSISHNSTTVNLDKYEMDTRTGFAGGTLNQEFGPISAKAPFHADDDADNTDSIVPISFASTEHYFYSRDASQSVTLWAVSPWGNTLIFVYGQGTSANCSGSTVTPAGATITCTGVGQGAVRIASGLPIIYFVKPTNDDDETPVYPATAYPKIGSGNTSVVINGNSTLDYSYYSDTSASQTNPTNLAANGDAAVSGTTSYGGGAILVQSDDSNQSYGFMQYADGDGGDGHMHVDITEQGKVFGSANQADYISVASTQPATCSVYEASDNSLVGSGTATSSNSEVYFLGFGTGDSNTYTSGGWYMECDYPVTAHFQDETAAEEMLMHPAMNRQFTYPTPSVGTLGTESTFASHTGSWISPDANSPTPTVNLSTDSTFYHEGSSSEKISLGKNRVDFNTVGLWHLDETNGDNAGDDVFDASNNDNNGEFAGTTSPPISVKGILGKARDFNGVDDSISLGNDSSLQITGSLSIEAWIKTDTTSGNDVIYSKFDDDGVNERAILFTVHSDGTLRLALDATGSWTTIVDVYSDKVVNDNQWHHVAATYNGSIAKVFIDGVEESRATYTGGIYNTPTNAEIGSMSDQTEYWFDGIIDEVRISNTARTAQEITDSYRLGRDQYLQETITSTNLSDDKQLPFYIAADRPGTYLEATISESNYANYQTDSNTIGLWHMNEGQNGNNNILEFTSTNIAGTAYSYWKSIDGQNTTVATGDTIEYDVYIKNNIAGVGGFDVRFTDSSYARDVSGWVDQDGLSCHPNSNISTDAYGKWFHRVCNIPSGMNGKTISWVDLVNEDDSGVAITAYYDNFIVKNSSEAIKATLYNQGSPAYGVVDLEHNASNTQAQAASSYSEAGINYIDQPTSSYIKDDGGNNNDGKIYSTEIISGPVGQARDFDGAGDYMTTGSLTGFNTGNTTHSIEAWIKPDSIPTTRQWPLLLGGATSGNHHWLYQSTGHLVLGAWGGGACYIIPEIGKWNHIAATHDGSTLNCYLNGKLESSVSGVTFNFTETNLTLAKAQISEAYFNGGLDEVRVSNAVRTADDIRQTYEVGLRTHPITIDFAASGDSGNLITSSSDYGFTVDATKYGLSNKGSALYLGDKIIVHEIYGDTEYVAQGTVTSVTQSTGAVTVSSWDASSTFPSGGYTANANFFKWQREYWDIDDATLNSHIDAVTKLTLKVTNGSEGRNIWLDDLSSSGGYLTNKSGSTISSPTNDYFQYRAIFSSWDGDISATMSAVTLDYLANSAPTAPTNLLTEGLTNPSGILDTTPEFSAIYNDPDTNDIANKYQIQVDDNSDFSSVFWDTGSAGTSMSNCNQGNRCSNVSYAGSALARGTTYYWRIKFWDDAIDNNEGAWSTGINTFLINSVPTPTLDLPINTATAQALTPDLKTTGTDVDSDYLRYKIELCEDESMTTSCQTFDQTSAQTGWSGQDAQGSTAYASGTQATYTLQTNLDYNTTYYWRSYAIDPAGTNSWSATQSPVYSFTTEINYSPVTPTLDLPTTGAGSVTIAPELKTTTTDINSDYIHYKIELCENSDMTLECQTFDQTSAQTGWSGQDAQGSTAYASGTQATYTLQTNLDPITTYYWRSYAIDPAGTNSWSATQSPVYSFTTTDTPTTATNCRIREASDDSSNTIIWTDVAIDENYYEVERSTDGGGWIDVATGLAAETTSYEDTDITPNHTYRYRVAPYFTGPVYGDWCYTDTLDQSLGVFSIN